MKHVPPPTGEPVESAGEFAALAAAVQPAWHQAVIRLANASERVAFRMEVMMGPSEQRGPIVPQIRRLVTDLIDFLDSLEADPDLEASGDELDASYPESGPRGVVAPNEDDEDGADDEPSLGSHGHGGDGAIIYQFQTVQTGYSSEIDCEGDEHDGREPEDEGDDNPDNEPSLGWTIDGCMTGGTGQGRYDVESDLELA